MSEAIDYGKKIFNFHPDEPFASCQEVLDTARKNMRSIYYDQGAAIYAEYLAYKIDEYEAKE